MPSSIRSNFVSASLRRLASSLGLACLLLLLAVPSALGQTGGGATLRGVVKDPGGAVVAGATVTLVSTTRGDQREAKSSGDGTYVFTSVDPGTYTVRVAGQGFKISEVAVTLAPSETRGLDIEMEVGGAAEVVS